MANDFLLLSTQIEPIEPELLLTAAEQAQTDRFAVDGGNGRNAHIDVLITRLQIHAPILRQSAFGDVHVRHYFQARDDGRLQDAQLRRHSDFVQNSIDSIPNSQIVFQRFDVNVGRALENCFANDLVYEFHYGRLRIVGVELDGGLTIIQDVQGASGLQDLIESFRPDAIEGFHRTQNLRARHQHPLGRLFQKLRCELAANGIEKIISRQDDRIFLHLDGQNVMLKYKTTRQHR